ncbi:MAG: glycerol-3-phosphate acyltransferase [Desulfobacteraceae bacterium]|nr:MAG: glycerol-3-phosphate acyltransferase [Desulfobacteraceae bacterium]
MKIFSGVSQFTSRIRASVRRYIDCLLENRDDYYTCYFPGRQGIISRNLIRLVTRNLTIDDSNVEKVSGFGPNDIVVYANKYKTTYNFIFFNTRLKALNVPFPEIGFDFRFIFTLPLKRLLQMMISHLDFFFHHFRFKDPYSTGYIRETLKAGKAGFMSLIEEEDFYNRFILSTPDPLSILISLQESTDKTIWIVPQDIIFITRPERKEPGFRDIVFGTNERPGKIRRLLSVLNKNNKVAVEFADPVNLKDYIERPDIKGLGTEFQCNQLRSDLVDIINRQKKSITGPTLISRQEITQDILTDMTLREYLADYSDQNEIPLQKVHKKSAAYINEIAANYNLRVINFLNIVLTWVFRNIFDGLVVNQSELKKMREASKDAPLILVPCHKSHLDYLLLPYIMFHNNMPCPHIAAGKNLSFWPLGPIFRGGGAFFLRRTFKGAELYSKIFAAYLGKLLYEGFNIKIFIEGGRSRTGKTLPPKLGGLAMIIQTYINKACDNLYFIPIYIGYDRVLEEDAYLKEIEGAQKAPENLSGLVRARKFLKKKYGKVYVKFNDPVSLKTFISQKNLDLEKTDNEEYMTMVRSLGYQLINSINTSVVVTPHGLIAAGVLNSASHSFTKSQLMDRVYTYMNLLYFVDANLADTLMIDPDASFSTVINMFLSRNFIELADEDEDDIHDSTTFIVKSNKRAILDYYKNNSISYFIFPAYTAMAILEIDRFNFSSADLVLRFKFLQKMFMDEFPTDENTTAEEYISSALKAFINEGIIVPDLEDTDRYQLTSEGLRKLKWFAAFLLPFLESYHTALSYFEKYTDISKHDEKERAKKTHGIGQKLYKRKTVIFKESLSLINYKNACKYFANNGIQGSEDHYNIDFYRNIIQRLLSLPVN